jgi:hypothetical protein
LFRDNEAGADGAGAALRATSGTDGISSLIIANSQFISNRFLTGTRPALSFRGAVDMQDIAVTINNIQVEGTLGSGLYAMGGSLSMADSQIRGNANSGIALVNTNAQVVSNTIEFNGNTGYEGGGVSFTSLCLGQLYLANNTIRHNVASQGGGLGGRVGPITVEGNLFQNNLALTGGGAMQLQKDTVITCTTPPSGVMQRNRLLGNQAERAGAILIDSDYRVLATNDIVANNVTSGFQTAAVHVATGQLDLRHGTLVGNGRYAISTGGSATAALTNTIVASHSVAGLAGNITSRFSLFFGNGSTCSNGATCTNDVNGDPRFFWPQTNDYHLCQNSAAIDQGANAGVNADFEGDVRPQGNGVDIGADEWNEVSCRRIRATYLPIVIRSGLTR